MKKTLVLGASLNPSKYSSKAIEKLLGQHIETVAIGKQEGTVHSLQIKTKLGEIQNIHTISLYLNAEKQKQYYNVIISLQPKRVIFNPGTENPELYALLKEHDIYFENSCTLVLLATEQY